MKFNIRIILAGLGAIAGGFLIMQMSNQDPLPGMEPQANWKGPVVMILGVALTIYGFRFAAEDVAESEQSANQPEGKDPE